ncbi:MAG: zinc-dependent alcohol dehydrogenase family protein [Siculibacillus sp.]|nr:zinc-dependent alcohol dehydrogenase family protein [Siculibacillus sp.]
MRAMVLRAPRTPLVLEERPDPVPGPGEIRVKVAACAVCRTDLHVVDGDLPPQRASVVPGHEIIGRVDALGPGVGDVALGERVGIPWLGHACGVCPHCAGGAENLCDAPGFTGWDRDGGFATHVVADAAFAVRLDDLDLDDVSAAPLMCAGLIGWRSLVRAGEGGVLGLYGFGAAAHIVAQMAIHQGRRVHAFTRPGDIAAQDFARSLGCASAAASGEAPPEPLDAAIIFAPVGALVPEALRAVRKGGRVVCGGIHMSDIPAFPYALLWQEREVVSVANLTRADARDFLAAARLARPHIATRVYPLEAANTALDDLRAGRFAGAAVLVP